MKKISTAATLTIEKVAGLKLTTGLDLEDRLSWYCVLDEIGGRSPHFGRCAALI